ncbi:MAG: GH25 family lysozyme [Lachnospiraceae bacterium]
MKNYRKKAKNTMICLLAAVMLLTAFPDTAVLAAENGPATASETSEELTPEEMYEIDGGDAEYWKYFDAEGNRIIGEDVQTCFSDSSSSVTTLKSPYNGASYEILSGYEVSHAIDVSKWNETIDWKKVLQDGVDSVIIRCANRQYGSGGALDDDPYFTKNIEGALKAGLKAGVYIFSQAITNEEAVEEANKCLTLCKQYLDRLDLPIVMDVEYAGTDGTSGRLYKANLSKAKQTEICKAFCDTIKAAGYQAMVYGNKSMLTDEMYPSQLTDAGYQVWLARYNTSAGYSASPYILWQYSENGNVSGISGKVDVNFLYTSQQADIAPEWDGAANQDDNNVQLSWRTVVGTEGYEIERSTDQKTWSDLVTLDAAAALCYIDRTTVPDQTYYYRIRTYYTKDGKKQYGSWSDTISVSTRLGTPALKSAQATSAGSVKAAWNSVPKAEGYLVYRRESGGSWDMENPVKKTSSTSFTDKTVEAEKTYYYTVRAYHTLDDELHYSDYNEKGIKVKVVPSAPKLTAVTALDYKSLKVTWSTVTGADCYRVYRKISDGEWKVVQDDLTETEYTDGTVNTGTEYTYTVSACFLKDDQKIEGSYDKTGLSGKAVLNMPVIKSAASAGYNSIKVSWGKVAGADGYRLYRKISGGSWSRIKDDLSSTSWTDTGLTTGTKYYYTVRAYRMVNGKKVLGDKAASVSGTAIPATVKLGKVTSVNYRNLKVTWSGVSGASGYRIYRKESGGSWKYLADVKSEDRSFTDGYLITTGKKYYYTVRAYRVVNGSRVYGKYDGTGISGKALPSTPSVTLTSTQKGKVKISWNKISGADGYAVYRKSSADGTWTRIQTIHSGSTTSCTVTATSKKTYYYTVRAYRKVGSSNVYSKYGAAVKITVK